MMAQFTFALVEIQLHENRESGDIIAIPHALAQTVMIERGILTFDAGTPAIGPVPARAAAAPKTITEDMFYETLGAKYPALPDALRAFIGEVAALGVYPEFRASLNLKIDIPDAPRAFNIGYVQKNGQLWTNPVSWLAGDVLATEYARRLAALIGGQVASGDGIYVSTNGTSAPLVSSLLPEHRQGWIDAIRDLVQAYEARLRRESGDTG